MSSPSFPSPIFSNDNFQKKPKRHECTICHKRFNRPSALQTHIFTHTGEKPFQCQRAGCGRRFAVISNLRRHYRIHSSNEAHGHRLSAEIRQQFIERLIEKTKRRETLEADDARYHKDTPHYAPTEGYFLGKAPSMLPELKSPAGSSSSSIAASPPSQHRDSVSTLAPLPPPLYPQPIKLPPLEPFVFFEPFASPSLQPLYESMLRAPSPFSADYRPVSR